MDWSRLYMRVLIDSEKWFNIFRLSTVVKVIFSHREKKQFRTRILFLVFQWVDIAFIPQIQLKWFTSLKIIKITTDYSYMIPEDQTYKYFERSSSLTHQTHTTGYFALISYSLLSQSIRILQNKNILQYIKTNFLIQSKYKNEFIWIEILPYHGLDQISSIR